MKKFVIVLILFIITPFFIISAIGQPPPPPPQTIPLDGGLLALLGAGIIFGIKKFYKKNNSEE